MSKRIRIWPCATAGVLFPIAVRCGATDAGQTKPAEKASSAAKVQPKAQFAPVDACSIGD